MFRGEWRDEDYKQKKDNAVLRNLIETWFFLILESTESRELKVTGLLLAFLLFKTELAFPISEAETHIQQDSRGYADEIYSWMTY